MELKTGMCRIGSLASLYFDVCEKEYSKLLTLEENINKEKDPVLKDSFESAVFECGIKVIIFASLYVEASINDFGGWQLGDRYFDEHIDRLDVISKWVVIPRMLIDAQINKTGAAYSGLKSLVKARNKLTHKKSKDIKLNDLQALEREEISAEEFYKEFHKAYRTLVYLWLEIDEIFGPQVPILQPFDEFNLEYTSSTPDNLKVIIDECKRKFNSIK